MFAKPWLDALIVLFVVLLFFGPKRLPSLGRSLGDGMREFKDSITGKSGSEDEDERPAVPEASSQPAAPAPPPPAAPPPPTAQAPPAEQPVPAAPPEPQATAPTAPPEETPAQSPPPVASSERRS